MLALVKGALASTYDLTALANRSHRDTVRRGTNVRAAAPRGCPLLRRQGRMRFNSWNRTCLVLDVAELLLGARD